MKKMLIALLVATGGVAHAIPVAGQGTWETTLQGRDFNADGVSDAFYDSLLNITWLADASYGITNGDIPIRGTNPFPGTADIGFATNYVDNLDVMGVTGWRLTHAGNQDDPSCNASGHGIVAGHNCSFRASPADSEFAFLYYVTLGNQFGALTNTGLFSNIKTNNLYFTGSNYTGQYATRGNAENNFSFRAGTKLLELEEFPMYIWAVHDGDVGAPTSPIPEPETYAMMLFGIAGLGAYARRKKACQERRSAEALAVLASGTSIERLWGQVSKRCCF